LVADIVPNFLPLELATTNVLVELPELLKTTLITLEADTGTLTLRYLTEPVPLNANV